MSSLGRVDTKRSQRTASRQLQFERQVKNPANIFACFLFVHFLFNIVYSVYSFFLHHSSLRHTPIVRMAPLPFMRSLDCYVHLAQFQGSIFYTLAECTKSILLCYFLPFLERFSLLLAILPLFFHKRLLSNGKCAILSLVRCSASMAPHWGRKTSPQTASPRGLERSFHERTPLPPHDHHPQG